MIASRPLLLASLCLVPACSKQPTANQTAQARPRERCADVQKERARMRAEVMRRVHDIQAQEEQADKNGETELQRSSKFLDLQQDIEGREHRLQLRLAECSGS